MRRVNNRLKLIFKLTVVIKIVGVVGLIPVQEKGKRRGVQSALHGRVTPEVNS